MVMTGLCRSGIHRGDRCGCICVFARGLPCTCGQARFWSS